MKKVSLILLFGILTFNVMAQQKIVQTAGREQLGEFAPEFARLNDDVCLVKYGAATTFCHFVTVVLSQ